MFSGKTFYSHNASLYPGVYKIGTGAGSNPVGGVEILPVVSKAAA